MSVTIIGIVGVAHSGKDTSADYIVGKMGNVEGREGLKVVKIALADQLKIICKKMVHLFYGVDIPIDDFYDYEKKEMIRDDMPKFMNNPFKIRTVLQQIGTEIFRDMLSKNVWCDYIKHRYLENTDNNVVIISDIRQKDEVLFFENMVKSGEIKGKFVTLKIIRNSREKLTPENQSHKSENDDFIDADCDIINDGTYAQLYEKLDKFLTSYII